MLGGAFAAVENLLPDFVLRRLLRYRLAARLQQLYAVPAEEQLQCLMDYVQAYKQLPISANAEAVRDQMYEFPLEFYKLLLGKNLKYSCAYYRESSYTLDEAEDAMLKLYCERAQIQDGQRILDLGGGYGSLALYIAHNFPSCTITSMSYSKSQTEFIQAECSRRGLTNVEAVDCDIASFKTVDTFDRVFAVQILEHLKNYQALFKQVSSFMNKDALMFIEYWGHKYFIYDMAGGTPQVPAATMLTENLLLYFQDDLSIVSQWRVNGTHQARASETWMQNIDKNFKAMHSLYARAVGDEERASQMLKSLRNNFLVGSEIFGFNGGQEWIISHQLFKKRH